MEINDPIRKYQDDLRKMSDSAEFLRPTVGACQDAIERAGGKAGLCLTSQGMTPSIHIMLFADSLDEGVVLMRELAKEGIHSKDKKYQDRNLFDTIAMREYQLWPDVKLTVMLSGEQCKMVQVGTKEVPVYDIQCGKEDDAAPRNPVASLSL